MSADQPQQPIPPSTPTEEPQRRRSGGASVGALIGIGIGVILLSFVASFLGARLSQTTAEPEPTPTPLSSAEYVAALEEILPAGSAVLAGTGAPESGKGYEGDVYIDVSTSDVYVFRGDDWELAGNIRENAAENLTGETGPAGETGGTGEPGEPGTQLLLGDRGARRPRPARRTATSTSTPSCCSSTSARTGSGRSSGRRARSRPKLRPNSRHNQKKARSCERAFLPAENRGFEPPRAFTQHAFQACAIGH